MYRVHQSNRRRHHQQQPRSDRRQTSSSALVLTTILALSASDALTFPSFHRNHHTGGTVNNNQVKSETQIHSSIGFNSLGLTIDDAPRSGLWSMPLEPLNGVKTNNREHHCNNKGGKEERNRRHGNNEDAVLATHHVLRDLVPHGPVPRGGSPSDIGVMLPTSSTAVSTRGSTLLSSITSVLSSNRAGSSAAAVAVLPQPRSNPIANTWSNISSGVVDMGRVTRRGARRVRRRVVCMVNMSVLRGVVRKERGEDGRNATQGRKKGGSGILQLESSMASTTVLPSHTTDTENKHRSVLRIGGMINRRLIKNRIGRKNKNSMSRRGHSSDSAVLATRVEASLDVLGDLDKWQELEDVMNDMTVRNNGMGVKNSASISSSEVMLQGRMKGTKSIEILEASSSTTTSSSSLASTSGSSVADITSDTFVIETPFFPIILPKSWEPKVAVPSSNGISVTTIEGDTVAFDTYDVVDVAEDMSIAESTKPSSQLLQAATQPLLPKDVFKSFTGRELYYPESMDALAMTGLQISLDNGLNQHVNWVGEKKTDKFLKDHGQDGSVGSDASWYEALDSTQEVLVWAGKFMSKNGYGAELPVIKTTSIIHQSPRYLAELLMDSKQVQVYNKMSLGRTDEKVFQAGIDTQEGSFGDGESKVVRSLAKPPMVNSLIEFVSCMHARKLRPDDMSIMSPNTDDLLGNHEGYILVSRSVTGGEQHHSGKTNNKGEKYVRNEILLGVNILKEVPGQPDKTELTSVAHVHSSLIPLMLAKNAGLKGAVDFVRDIRSL